MRRDRDLDSAGRSPAVMLRLSGGLAVLVVALACTDPPTPDPLAGAPLDGLTRGELARFEAGKALFNTVFTPERGLGPAFNENQCSACHTSPAPGGVGGERIRRVTRFVAGRCDPMAEAGGANIRSRLTAQARVAGLREELAPPGGVEGRFTAPALYGLGLVEAVPLAALLALADSADRDQDGISGRVGRTDAGGPARFGRKGEIAGLRDFVGLALHQEMGITNPAHPHDLVQGAPRPGGDPAPDPELDSAAVGLLTDFVRFLAPPPRGQPPPGSTSTAVREGERAFERTGCARCHVPELRTGPNPTSALNLRTVRLYSDLLLHDLGSGLADVCGPAASPSELRTEPLIGLRFRELLLHDGRSTDLEQSILLHGGEAGGALQRYRSLGPRQRMALLAFLHTL